MKITNIDMLIEEFRNGRDIWSRTTVELAVREIERLRKRIAELEVERKVYCTGEGDYPTIGVMTIFEDYAETYIGGFDGDYWFDQNEGQLEDTVGDVYWKPLISLELQYAQQVLNEVRE